MINDPSGKLREAMYNLVDHPIPPLQEFRDIIVATYGEANARTMTQSDVGALSDLIKQNGGELSLAIAGSITCPVLLIVGDHDMFVPPALASQLAARIRTAEALVAEGAEHNVYGDRPEWVTQSDPRLGGEALETVLYTYECLLMHDHLARRSWQRLRRYRIA